MLELLRTANIVTALADPHTRAGNLVAISTSDAWFTYYYWRDDRLTPDFARTVEIHRKPGPWSESVDVHDRILEHLGATDAR